MDGFQVAALSFGTTGLAGLIVNVLQWREGRAERRQKDQRKHEDSTYDRLLAYCQNLERRVERAENRQNEAEESEAKLRKLYTAEAEEVLKLRRQMAENGGPK